MAQNADDENRFERIRKRLPSKRTRHTVAQLIVDPEKSQQFEERTGEVAPRFEDRSLQSLHERGVLDEIVVQLKSGKEATVFVGRGPAGVVAVKLYRDLRVRSFRNDSVYREGRFIGDARTQRAIDNGTRRGQSAHELLWVEEEFRQLTALFEAGIPVPRPIAHDGYAIVMELIGDGIEPALRLSELLLEGDAATSAFNQSVDILRAIVESGRVHGDYSTFNLLWHNERVIVIDLPQVMFMHESANAGDILRRDIASLCHSFRRHGIDADEADVLRNVIDEETWRRLTLPSARINTAQ
ncbi:MAG: phosphotransferase [bacterium]|nr:phosphotransferase [Candidatus Kapabacteria bacterium]